MEQIEDKVLDQFADIDKKWRDSCVELAWLEQLERSGQLPEWNYKLPSIISEGVDEGQLASSKRGPCPLCSQQFFSVQYSCQVKWHLRGFHKNHSISHAGWKHLICRLPCSPHSHYHCSCGITISKKQRAKFHIKSCSHVHKLSEVIKNEEPEDVGDSEDIDELSEVVKMEEPEYVGGSEDIDELSEVVKMEEPEDVGGSEDIDELSEVVKMEEPEDVGGSEDIDELSEVVKMEEPEDVGGSEDINELFEVVKREEPEDVGGTEDIDELFEVVKTEEPEDVGGSEDIDELSEVVKMEEPEDVGGSEDIDELSEVVKMEEPEDVGGSEDVNSGEMLGWEERPLFSEEENESEREGVEKEEESEPAWVSLFEKCTKDFYEGFVSPENFHLFFHQYIVATGTSFTKVNGRNLLSVYDYHGHAVKWCSTPVKGPNIPFIGQPFVVLTRATFQCHHDPVHSVTPEQGSDHSYAAQPPCPAKVYVTKIAIFVDDIFHVDEWTKKKMKVSKKILKKKMKASKKILKTTMSSKGQLQVKHRIYVKLPKEDDHQGHSFDKVEMRTYSTPILSLHNNSHSIYVLS